MCAVLWRQKGRKLLTSRRIRRNHAVSRDTSRQRCEDQNHAHHLELRLSSANEKAMEWPKRVTTCRKILFDMGVVKEEGQNSWNIVNQMQALIYDGKTRFRLQLHTAISLMNGEYKSSRSAVDSRTLIARTSSCSTKTQRSHSENSVEVWNVCHIVL